MEKKGYYVIMGVDGEDTMYYQFPDADSLHKALRDMIVASIKDEYKGENDDHSS